MTLVFDLGHVSPVFDLGHVNPLFDYGHLTLVFDLGHVTPKPDLGPQGEVWSSPQPVLAPPPPDNPQSHATAPGGLSETKIQKVQNTSNIHKAIQELMEQIH